MSIELTILIIYDYQWFRKFATYLAIHPLYGCPIIQYYLL